jgi:SPP1 gp7 family putative phage head morphogenesis protein
MAKINPDDFVFAFDLPPEDAIEYLEKKGYAITFDWREMLNEAHARAFTVAKVMQLEVLTQIREELERAQRKGLTFEEFRKNLKPRLSDAGWWHEKFVKNPETGEWKAVDLSNPSRLENIFRTNMQSALMAGRLTQQMETIKTRPYARLIAISDNRTTSLCKRLNGTVFRLDDAKMLRIYPPNHFRCRDRIQTLTEAEVRRKGYTVAKAGTFFANKKNVPSEGFNAPPSVEWKPDIRKYAPDLRAAFTRSTKDGPPPYKPKKSIKAKNVGKVIAKRGA